MQRYLKYWPALLILVAFLAGRFSKDDSSKEREAQWKKNEEILFTAITQKDAQIIAKDKQGEAISRKMSTYITLYKDSLKAERKATIHYKKLYEKVNLRNATVPELDSLRAVLRAKSLHPTR